MHSKTLRRPHQGSGSGGVCGDEKLTAFELGALLNRKRCWSVPLLSAAATSRVAWTCKPALLITGLVHQPSGSTPSGTPPRVPAQMRRPQAKHLSPGSPVSTSNAQCPESWNWSSSLASASANVSPCRSWSISRTVFVLGSAPVRHTQPDPPSVALKTATTCFVTHTGLYFQSGRPRWRLPFARRRPARSHYDHRQRCHRPTHRRAACAAAPRQAQRR